VKATKTEMTQHTFENNEGTFRSKKQEISLLFRNDERHDATIQQRFTNESASTTAANEYIVL
jgi:hypothetical protein